MDSHYHYHFLRFSLVSFEIFIREQSKFFLLTNCFWIPLINGCVALLILQKKVASTTKARVEPEKTYASQVQKRKTVAAPTSNTEVNKTTETIDEKRLRLIAEFDANSRVNLSFRPLKLSDSDSEMGSNNNISTRQNIGMVVIVYGSATLVYIQLMLLAAFLQTAVIPPGLVFLVSSLGYIGYVVFQVCAAGHFSSFFSPIFLN